MANVMSFFIFIFHLYSLLFISASCHHLNGYYSSNQHHESQCRSNQLDTCKTKKYLLYDVNSSEGFNLRRDVYIRMAILLKQLGIDWTLVLPAWNWLHHWKKVPKSLRQETFGWEKFFDTSNMQKFVPLIEFQDFMDLHPEPVDVVLNLIDWNQADHVEKHKEEAFTLERVALKNCSIANFYQKMHDSLVYGFSPCFGGKIMAKSMFCIQFSGFTSTLAQLIKTRFNGVDSVIVSGAEIILHRNYGDSMCWSARRSMRFSRFLVDIGDEFRAKFLDSHDIQDRTVVDKSWLNTETVHGQAVGGPYIAVHLRRRDFAEYRKNYVPSIACSHQQIVRLVEEYGLKRVFVATDAEDWEWQKLEQLSELDKMSLYRYRNDSLHPGQVAIIDQWIAAHAQVFVGTLESTFTFRIQEEREILGFQPNKTFISLCPRCDMPMKTCTQPSKWLIKY